MKYGWWVLGAVLWVAWNVVLALWVVPLFWDGRRATFQTVVQLVQVGLAVVVGLGVLLHLHRARRRARLS